MNLFEDFQFFVYLAVAAVPAIILGIKEKQIKYYAFAVSLIFIWLALGGNIRAMVSLTGYCFFEFAVLQTWLRIVEKRGRVGGLYVLYIILGIAPLAVCKISGTLHITTIGFIGISYMTFKVVQMIIEIYDGLIKKVPIFDYFSFLLFFPAVLSGPIDRSRRYSEDIESIPSKSEYENMLGNGLMKLVMGIVYKFVIAASIYQAILWLGMKHTMQSAFIYMYSYGFYLFFDFAGYSLMAIGCGYIFGIRLPENFKLPFISKDISDFWNRWHITLSHWFRDYLFSRMMMRWIRGNDSTAGLRLPAAASWST